MDKNFVREIAISGIRQVSSEDDTKTIELSFSSEEPYQRWYDHTEVLDHKGVQLDRLNEIGVVLYNHNRDKVIGKVKKAWVEDNRGLAVIELDDDEFSTEIYKKVESGTLKGVSVGYSIDTWEEVKAGKESTDGFAGPCYIARRWTPYEISIVSIPADGTVGVGRSEDDTQTKDTADLSMYENIVQFNKNKLGV
jgi:caudovirus prohead protease|nr:MAG TPA: major capsid protein [Caudoviricetes sp.]